MISATKMSPAWTGAVPTAADFRLRQRRVKSRRSRREGAARNMSAETRRAYENVAVMRLLASARWPARATAGP